VIFNGNALTSILTSSAIGLDATNPVFYCNRAAAYSRIGEYQKAIDDCNQAIRYDPNYGKGEKILEFSLEFRDLMIILQLTVDSVLPTRR
jgi:tetratricopeptide (TPR) repeat protein